MTKTATGLVCRAVLAALMAVGVTAAGVQLAPAQGTSVSGTTSGSASPTDTSVTANGSAEAQGAAATTPGVVSGNVVQVPVEVPANVCGNTVNVVGLLNPATGNTCINK
jgi:hypothetical protein